MLNTVVGAVPGALPPLMGWTAATGTLDAPGWGLFGILFFWQLPHFMAIAWLYRDDYAGAGFRMLSGSDPDGRRTAASAVRNTVALFAVSLFPSCSAFRDDGISLGRSSWARDSWPRPLRSRHIGPFQPPDDSFSRASSTCRYCWDFWLWTNQAGN